MAMIRTKFNFLYIVKKCKCGLIFKQVEDEWAYKLTNKYFRVLQREMNKKHN